MILLLIVHVVKSAKYIIVSSPKYFVVALLSSNLKTRFAEIFSQIVSLIYLFIVISLTQFSYLEYRLNVYAYV